MKVSPVNPVYGIPIEFGKKEEKPKPTRRRATEKEFAEFMAKAIKELKDG